jgi:predicted SnoaL-like aldol condensation-catalyzing enzyme
MAESKNKALVRRLIREVLQDLDANAVDELVTDDFVSHTDGKIAEHWHQYDSRGLMQQLSGK